MFLIQKLQEKRTGADKKIKNLNIDFHRSCLQFAQKQKQKWSTRNIKIYATLKRLIMVTCPPHINPFNNISQSEGRILLRRPIRKQFGERDKQSGTD